MSRRSHHPIRRHVRPRHPEAKRGTLSPEHADAIAEPMLAEPGAAEPGVEETSSAVVETEVESDVSPAPEPTVPDAPMEAAIEAVEDEPTDEPVDEPAAELAEAPAIEPPPVPMIEPTKVPAPPAIAAESSAPPVAEVVARVAVPTTSAGPVGSAAPPGPPGAATAPQLRRFIKSRSYIPMHELRRRFGIAVEDDDVAAIAVGGHTVYVGLPPREGELLGELLRAGDIGYEASFDPIAPVIVGVFPIRPVTRG